MRVIAWNNENFARSLLLKMPGYTFPIAGSFILEGRRIAGSVGAPDFVFSTAKGNARVIAVDAENEQVTLALFEKLSLVNDLSGAYVADLVYVEGAETANVGRFEFVFKKGATATPVPVEPAYDDVASWGPIVDLSGETEATVLQFLQRGLTGPGGGGGGVTDHGALTGLADDDHTQYFNTTRGDARYSQLGHAHAIANVTGLQTALDAKAATASLATVATSGSYTDLSSKPTLGDAAAKNTGTTAGTVAAGDDSRITGAAQKASNLSDLASAATARTNLGLGSLATKSTVDNADWSGTALSVANGGTGTSTPALVAGTNITISGTWPNQTINASGGSYSAGDGLTLTSTTFSLGGAGLTYTAASRNLKLSNASTARFLSIDEAGLFTKRNASGVYWEGVSIRFEPDAGSGNRTLNILNPGGNNIVFGNNGTYIAGIAENHFVATKFGLTAAAQNDATVIFERDANDILGVRRGTNNQTVRVYRTYTDSSNYQRLTLSWSTSTALVMNEGAGTGADGSVAFNDAALATNATKGFLMIPSCAGAPTGTPVDIPTGQVPIVWDSTNLKLYVYTGGAWKASAAFT